VTALVVTQDYCHARLLASHLSQCLGWDATAARQLPEASSRCGSDAGILVVEYAVLNRADLTLARIQSLIGAWNTLVIGVHSRDDVLPFICAGVRGCVGMQADEEAITEGVQAIARGDRWFDRSVISPTLATLAAGLGPGFMESASSRSLAVREGCVLALLAQGATCAKVAEMLCVSVGTARNILSTLYKKLGVHSRTAAVAEARKRGLISSLPGGVTI
jgi:DNA-binding NarL/FixJ family response regulator